MDKVQEQDLNNLIKMYESILDNTDHVIYMKDRECVYFYVNRRFEDLFDVSKEEVIGLTDYDIFPQNAADSFRENDLQVMADNSSVGLDEVIEGDDFTQHYYSNKFPLHNQKGEVIGICGISTDITEIMETKNKLQTSEEQYRTLVSNVQGVVYKSSTSTDWKMYYISDYIEQLSGYPASDFIGNSVRSYASIIHPEDQIMVEETVDSGLRLHSKFLITYRIIRKDGNIRWVHEKGQGHFSSGDEEPEWLDGVIIDITEEKQLEDKLKRQDKLLQRKKIKAVNALVRGICHELGTPLGTNITISSYIRSTLQLLLDDIDQDVFDKRRMASELIEVIENLDLAIANMKKEISIIENLRVISETQQNKLVQSIHVKSYFDTILRSLEMQYADVAIQTNVDAAETLYIRCVPGLIYQVISALFENSVVHGFNGLESGEIRLKIEDLDSEVRIEYSDNGRGIDENVIDKVHDPYFTTRMGIRSGLGLYTVFSIITQTLKGNVKVISSKGIGTIFEISFPKE